MPEAETVPGFPWRNIRSTGKIASRKVKTLIKLDEIERALSLERFNRYVEWAAGDRSRALELYTLNARLSEALYISLQMLEVALRNRIHIVMTAVRHEQWFMDDGLLAVNHQRQQLSQAIADIRDDGKPVTAGRIVAALTFSFWTSMVSPTYEQLWQTTLHRVARRENGKGLRRKDFSAPLKPIRTLRNRIAHHEPILQWNLPQHHANMLTLTGWLSPAAAAWVQATSRFDSVYPAERIVLNQPSGPISLE